jgi:predicted MPP superfamily phosphohydrolase
MTILTAAFWTLIGLGAAAGIWGIGIERHLRVVRFEEQSLAVLPSGAKQIRVLHISDFHLAPWQKRKLAWIAKLGQLDVDVIVNTGDNLGHPAAIGPALIAMAGIGARPGVFVNGSNDYYAPKPRNPLSYLAKPSERVSDTPLDTDALVAGLEGFGWRNLNNRGSVMELSGLKLGWVGIDDMHDGIADLASIPASVKDLGRVDVLLGVTHAPYLAGIDAMNDAGVQVLFAGHTHGGQVCIPGYGALTTNCDLPTKAAKGLSSWSRGGSQMWLNVCAGLGTSIFAPVRFACRPEVRVLNLVSVS